MAARERIANLADTDDLTGIWNRRYFRRQLPYEIERARTFNVPLSLILFDIDDFKRVNDVHGHGVGDELLRLLAETLRACVRPDDIVSLKPGSTAEPIVRDATDLTASVAPWLQADHDGLIAQDGLEPAVLAQDLAAEVGPCHGLGQRVHAHLGQFGHGFLDWLAGRNQKHLDFILRIDQA